MRREAPNEIDDWTPGGVIYAYEDGTIVLDDGITTYNKVKARQWIEADGVCENCGQWRRLRTCDFCAP